MPFKHEYDGSKIPTNLKKSAKLSQDDKNEMRKIYKMGGISYRELSILFKVSKSSAIYAVNPDRQKRNYELRVLRGGSSQYYDREKQTAAIRKHRRYKNKLAKEGKLTNERI